MKRFLLVLVLCLFMGFSAQTFAQCSEFETEVILVLQSDNYGAEMYWEVTIEANGQEFLIDSGGCEDIKPGGLRLQNALLSCAGVYETGTHVVPICIPTGSEVTFTMYDDYGDGICCSFGEGSYEILGAEPPVVGGQFTTSVSHTFVPVGIEARTDMAMRSITTGNDNYLVEGTIPISGSFENVGTTTVNSVTVNWSIDGGNVYKQTIADLDIPPYTFQEVDFTHLTAWSALKGSHDLEIWISKVNGGVDDDTSNDRVNKTFNIEQQVTENDVVIEHFTQASCPPCATRNPAFDAVISSQRFRVAPIKYHTEFPGFDPMHNENPSEPNVRVNYYQVPGVPTAYIQGTFESGVVPQDLDNLPELSQEATQFVIELEESMLPGNMGAQVNVKITAKNDISNEDLMAHVVVIEEMVEYESAPGTNGEAEFPQVMRKMLSGSAGAEIGAQTEGQVNDLSFTYEYPTFVNPAELHTIVFIQDRSSKQIFQGYNSTGQTGTNVESNIKGGSVQGMGVTIAVQDEICPGTNDGSITVDATQVDGVYAVVWDDISSTDNMLSDLSPGIYSFTVVGGNGNQESYSVQVGVGEGPDVRFDLPEEYCIEDGKLTFDVIGLSGGVFAVNGENIEGSDWTPSKAGIYTISYTIDAGDCANTLEKQISVLDPIDAAWSVANGNESLEFCQSDLPLQLSPIDDSGEWSASTGGNIELDEEGNAFLTASIGTTSPFGIYVVTHNGCGASESKNITVYKQPGPTVAIPTTLDICASDETTGIELKGITPICGNCDLSFNVYDGEDNLIYQSTAVNEDMFYPGAYIPNDTEGEFAFYVTSVNGLCEGPRNTLTINTTAAPAVAWDGEVIMIEEGTTTTLDATSDGATAYLWSNGETTPMIDVSEMDTYTVEITGANGCVTIADVTVSFSTDIEDLTKPTLVRSYPNPANQYTVVELVNITEDLKLQVRDLAGRLIVSHDIQSGSSQFEVQTSALAEGTYLYQLSKDNVVLSTQKIVVIH